MNKQLLLYCFLCQCYRCYMDMDTTRGTGASQGNVVCFKRFNEAWLEQLFILLKVIFYKEYFDWGQIIIIIIMKLGILVESRVKTSNQEQGDMYLKCGIRFRLLWHLMVVEPKNNIIVVPASGSGVTRFFLSFLIYTDKKNFQL